MRKRNSMNIHKRIRDFHVGNDEGCRNLNGYFYVQALGIIKNLFMYKMTLFKTRK